jgi:hypothetical protein
MQTINIGLTDTQRQGVINLLNNDLADSYLLLVKTKKYHWDVVAHVTQKPKKVSETAIPSEIAAKP